MATQAQYIATPKRSTATISTANTNFDGTGAMAIVYTAGALGARIERVVVQATATTAAGLVNLFVSDDTAANTAANTHLYDSAIIAAVTPNASIAPFSITMEEFSEPNRFPIILSAGQTLRASTSVAQAFRITAIGGDY